MNNLHLLISILIHCFAMATPAICGDLRRDDISGSSSSKLIYDFLTSLKQPYSVNSSKALWKYMDPSAVKKKEHHPGDAAIRTIHVVRIKAMKESVAHNLVTAVIDSDESENEVLTFEILERDGRPWIRLPKEYDPFSPYLTPWHIRMSLDG